MGANELVGIELQLKGYDGVMSDMRTLDQMLNGLRGRRNRVQIETNLKDAKKEVIALQGELNKLKQAKNILNEKGIKSDGLDNKIKQISERLRDANQRARELSYSLRNLSGTSFMTTFNRISSAVAHMGFAMQSAGNALTKLTSPFQRFTSGIVMGAGYKALNKFTEGLNNGFNRYDTMKKYPKIMAAFGYSNEESQKSIDALDKSVRGLPTGLDEMVDMAQRFTATVGDIDKGTQLAIAANNAFLASMSTDTQKYQGMMQLQDVLGGKDMNAREWNSLVSSMTPAIVKMGESLGYTSKNMSEWIQKVRDGKVDNQDFIDQLIKIGNEGGSLEAMAQESKNTWQAFFANVGNAASRMTAGLIQSLDEISQMLTGKDVNQLLAENVITGIDNMTASMKDWIKAHPEEITDFFKSLKEIDLASIIKGTAEAMMNVADLGKRFAQAFGGKDLSRLGKLMVYGNILGRTLTITGGLLKGTRHIFGGIGASTIKGIQSVRGIRKYGWGGWLGRMLTVGEDASAGGKAIETASKTAPKMGKFMTGLSSVFKGWGQITAMVGGTALVGWGSFKAFKSMMKDLKEMTDITKEIDWGRATGVLTAMGGFFSAYIGLSRTFGGAGGLTTLKGGGIFSALTLMFAGTFWADMALIKRGFKAIADSTQYLNDALDNIGKVKDVDNVHNVKYKIQNAITLFNQITDMLAIERNNPIFGEGGGGLKELDRKSANTIKNVSESIASMVDAVKSLNKLSGTKMKLGGLSAVMAGLRNGLGQMSNLLIDMPSVFKDATASQWAKTMSGTMENLKTAFKAFVGKGGVLNTLPKIISKMTELKTSNTFTDFPSNMKTLGEALTSVYTSLQGIGSGSGAFATNIENFRAGLVSMKKAIKQVQKISGMKVSKDVSGKIQGIIDSIATAFDAGKVSELTGNITAFAMSIRLALDMFESLNGDIEIKAEVKLSKGFDSSVTTVVGKIEDARRRIKKAMSGFPTSFYKTVNVHINANVDVSGAIKNINAGATAVQNAAATAVNGATNHRIGGHNAPESATGGRISRNGVLYRSGGGTVFRPRGTDKVPAMLTEGEYVHRKQATDFWGIDFMRKVNAMDVRGAMKAMLTRGGASTNIGRQSIFNNTVNNNQRITQNISTNNPSFATTRLGRFAGAL